jgi:hypothetical protein
MPSAATPSVLGCRLIDDVTALRAQIAELDALAQGPGQVRPDDLRAAFAACRALLDDARFVLLVEPESSQLCGHVSRVAGDLLALTGDVLEQVGRR